MSCKVCKRDKKIRAREMCAACYQRWYKTGSTDYQRWGKRNVCHIDDCGRPVVSGGLCGMHRRRLERHGHTNETRPDSWGAIEKHPLRNSWRHIFRERAETEIAPEWRDFLQFVIDVGSRPSKKHKLFSADDNLPIGPNNFVWKEAITQKVPGESDATYRNRVQKVYRAVRREAFIGYELKRRFGISIQDYEKMHADQGGKCAICGSDETLTIRGTVVKLALDHCHKTKQVRGLLCSACNRGLGHFKDNPDLLRCAIEYLK